MEKIHTTNPPAPAVMVAGGGISGMAAAITLTEVGYPVWLVDRGPATAGILNSLDHQFPDNHCGMCRLLPMIDRSGGPQTCLRKGVFHDRIQVLSLTTIRSVSGSPGHLDVEIERVPAGVVQEACTGCGACEAVCPISIPDRFNAGLSQQKAIHLPIPHQAAFQRVIDWDACTRCGACVDACPEDAVQLDDETTVSTMENIAAVILADGAAPFTPEGVDLYGTNDMGNVVTAEAFERMISSSGPYRGKPVLPAGDGEIKKIAWIQCVGSRNKAAGADYCSSVCCMFALKEAVLAREKLGPETETTIFYMDLRTVGKGYQHYRDHAEEAGVRLIRCRPHSVQPAADVGADTVMISYVNPDGQGVDEVFDLVVLSTGRAKQQTRPSWAQQEGVLSINDTPRLTDIADSLIAAGATGDRLLEILRPLNIIPTETIANGDDRSDAWEQAPYLQIILAGGSNGDAAIDWETVVRQLKSLPVNLDIIQVTTLAPPQERESLIDRIDAGPANRLLIADIRPPLNVMPHLKQLAEGSGIPRALSASADLSGLQPDADNPSDATRAVYRIVAAAAMKLYHQTRPDADLQPVVRAALVVGGGPAGMRAALSLANQQVDVTLVEKSDHLGGNDHHIMASPEKEAIAAMRSNLEANANVTILCDSIVQHSSGRAGQFTTRIRSGSGKDLSVFHGAAIVATGGGPAATDAYALGTHQSIMTLFDFEKTISDDGGAAESPRRESVVFIQCAGSREAPRNYCSRICCLKSVKAAIRLKNARPNTRVSVFYRDMMTCGDDEALYSSAREKGVLFYPFDVSGKPEVTIADKTVVVTGFDPILQETARIEADCLVLATGLAPGQDKQLRTVFGLSKTRDGFLKEADRKWRPVDSGREGIFICGLARAPMNAAAAMKEGRAAAIRALRILNRKTLRSSVITARVRQALCSLCEACVAACPYHARYLDPNRQQVSVDAAACQGCGTCAAVCPNSATVIGGYEESGVMDAIEMAL